jgi:multidrug efflux system membrane fusion protein
MDSLTRDTVDLPASVLRTRRWPMVVLCLAVIAAIGATIWLWPANPASTKDRDHKNTAIPVLAATAALRDMPIYLEGLGTVQAYNTVTIKAMIDGPLVSVNFKEGQQVHPGEVLAQIDRRPYQAALDQAIAKKAQDEALLANARLDLARYQKLVSNNYTSAQQADTAKSQVAQDEAQIRQDQAQIDTAGTNLSYTTITAPIEGRTGIRLVDPGNIVHAIDTTGLVVITQIQPISVVFTLPQQDLPAVARAMKQGSAEAQAYTQGSNGAPTSLLDTGTLTVLDNQVDPTTGTIKLKATFPNADSKLWPGGFVGIRLRVDIAHNAVVVPPSAIQRGPRGPYVFIIGPNNTVTRQTVTTGYEDQTASIVTDGLTPGQQVVVDGASRLTDTSKITLAQPAPEAAPATDQPAAPGTRRTGGG